jgi:hypothetical protein
MGVCFRQGSRNAQHSGCKDHWAGDVTACAQRDVGPPPAQDANAGRDRRARPGERPRQRQPEAAGKTFHCKDVKLESRRPDRPGILVRRERDLDAAGAQRLRDRERGQDVPRRAAGGDQAPERLLRRHG